MKREEICCESGQTKLDKGLFAGFILGLGTVLFHLVHCIMPILMPLLIFLSIPMPGFLHHIQIPWPITALSTVFVVIYLFRSRFIFFRLNR